MKKATAMLALLLSVALLVGGLTACSSTSGESDNWLANMVSSSTEMVSGSTTAGVEETAQEEEPQEDVAHAEEVAEETVEVEVETEAEAEAEAEAPESPEPEEEETPTPTPEEITEDVEDTTAELEDHESNETASSGTATESAGTPAERTLSAPTNSSIKTLTASSQMIEESNLGVFYHLVDNVIDGSTQTAWVEDISGNGMGEWIEFTFNDTYRISGVEITNGYQKTETVYENNGRVEWVRYTFSDGTTYESPLKDRYGTSQRVDFPTPVDTTSLRIEIISVYPGALYQDTCITEIRMY